MTVPAVQTEARVPVQALAACAQACLDRIGTAAVAAVDLVVPVPSAPSGLGQVVTTSQWFALAPPTARAAFEVSLDVGVDSPAVQAHSLLERLQRLHTAPFAFHHVRESEVEDDRAATVDDLWFTPARSRTVVGGSCPQWSLEAAGWSAALVLEVARELGSAGMVRLQVTRGDIRLAR